MIVHIVIRPGIAPLDRATIEDMVVEALGAGAESVGGGTLLDVNNALVESDFDVEVPQGERSDLRDAALQVLGRISFTQPTVYTVEVFANDTDELDEGPVRDEEPAN